MGAYAQQAPTLPQPSFQQSAFAAQAMPPPQPLGMHFVPPVSTLAPANWQHSTMSSGAPTVPLYHPVTPLGATATGLASIAPAGSLPPTQDATAPIPSPAVYQPDGNPVSQPLIVSSGLRPTAASSLVDDLKLYIVEAHAKSSSLRFAFAGVDMIRKPKRVHQRAVTAAVTKTPVSEKSFAATQLRVWSAFGHSEKNKIDTSSHLPTQMALTVQSVRVHEDAVSREYDDAHGGLTAAFESNDLHTASYTSTPEALHKIVQQFKEDNKHLGPDDLAAEVLRYVNSDGYVSYHKRLLGVKKTKQNCQLGLGARATPIEFATLAGRLDNVLTMLQLGASPAAIKRATAIASGNGFVSIVSLLTSSKGLKTSKRRPVTTEMSAAREKAAVPPALPTGSHESVAIGAEPISAATIMRAPDPQV